MADQVTARVYCKEIDIDGDLTWEVLRRAIDEFLAENELSPESTKIDYFDFSYPSSLVFVVAGGCMFVQ
jgi:hypothetical protein